MERRVITGLLAVLFVFVGLFAAFPQKTEAQAAAITCAERAALRATIAKLKAHAAISDAVPGVLTAPGILSSSIDAAFIHAAEEELSRKESCLDSIFYYITKLIIHKITQSTIAWINSGFQGQPSFIDNPGQFFGDVVNEELLNFIEEVFPDTGPFIDFLCAPQNFQFDLKMRFLLKFGKYQSTPDKVGCTLTDIGDNISNGIGTFADSVQDFYDGNFTNGGWERWFQVTQEVQNNPIALEYQIESQFLENVAYQLNMEQTVADWGQGFKSMVEDVQSGVNSVAKIALPGKFIEDQLVTVFGSPIRQLELADEFNEVVTALFSQLVTQVLQGGFGGLGKSGSSPANSNGSGRSFAQDLYSESPNAAVAAYNAASSSDQLAPYGDNASISAGAEANGEVANSVPAPAEEIDPDKNIAVGAEVINVIGYNTSNYGQNTQPRSITNGSVDGYADYHNLITNQGYNRAVQIRLNRSYDLAKIDVYERPGTEHGLKGFWIFISDEEITGTTPAAINALPDSQVKSIFVQGDGNGGAERHTVEFEYRGRYIMIMRADPVTNNAHPDIRLELAEIMAYQQVPPEPVSNIMTVEPQSN